MLLLAQSPDTRGLRICCRPLARFLLTEVQNVTRGANGQEEGWQMQSPLKG